MKKFLFSVLALAGFAACSTDGELNETIAPEQKETLTIFATQQDFDDTRVSISADGNFHPTVLTWNEGDQIKLVTGSGISETLSAEEVNGKSATFRTTKPVNYVENDTYYACYPASQQINTTMLLYSVPRTQSGLAKDAVVLYGTGDVDAETEGVQMNFKPVNSVLFISVADAPTEGFSKLEINDYNGKQILAGDVTFNGETTDRELATGGTITINGTDANNNLKSVYVSLPGGVEFETGYILTYTTQNGMVMSFGFNAGKLEEGYIYEAQVKWTTPTVTLGAKTTYSYASTNPSKANSMGGGAAAGSGTTIFFNADYKSSFSNVQNAMIEDCGFIVNGTYYKESAGQVFRDGKDFYMANLTGMSKADHTVQAFIKIKHNDTIITSAPETLSVTGIPYSVDCYNKGIDYESGWETTGVVEYWKGRGWQTCNQYRVSNPKADFGNLFSPTFHAPNAIDITYSAQMCFFTQGSGSRETTIYSGVTTGTNLVKTNSKKISRVNSTNNPSADEYTSCIHNATIPKGDISRIYVADEHVDYQLWARSWVYMRSFEVKYAE